MEFVADVADAEAGALADLVVFEVFVVFEGDEHAVIGVEFGDEELQGADGFEAAERLLGIWRVALPLVAGVDGSFTAMVTEVVEGEVSDRAEQPGAGVADILPVRVEFDERVLDEVLGGFPLAYQSVGVSEQCGFLRFENLPECRFVLHGISKRDHRIASGISPRMGAGGGCFHDLARAGSCSSSIKTQTAEFS